MRSKLCRHKHGTYKAQARHIQGTNTVHIYIHDHRSREAYDKLSQYGCIIQCGQKIVYNSVRIDYAVTIHTFSTSEPKLSKTFSKSLAQTLSTSARFNSSIEASSLVCTFALTKPQTTEGVLARHNPIFKRRCQTYR